MSKEKPLTLQEALEKIDHCYTMQSNEKNECYEHGLEIDTCKSCVHYVSPGTAWMLLAALSKTNIRAR